MASANAAVENATAANAAAAGGPMNTGEGKLLMISDLEGCNEFGPPPKKVPQSQVMCSTGFFTAIAKFLGKPKNKVAFLGDYFDQGPKVVESINEIVGLHKKFGDKVIIILGNRDLNKLRFVYELDTKYQGFTFGKGWSLWNDFYKDSPQTTDPVSRVKLILNKSMGAPAIPQLIMKSSGNSQVVDEEASIKLLKETFSSVPFASGSNPEFTQNVRYLFEHGKIVHYDTDFKTLLSHAGGNEPITLHTDTYYTRIKSELTKKNELGGDPLYYDKIEIVRKMLEKPPTGAEIDNSFNQATYNKPLETVLIELGWKSPIAPLPPASQSGPSEDYFLLQGLGLKPDGNNPFNSFIQSCDIVAGCQGPKSKNQKEYELFFDKFPGVKFIAHGHVPHCVPIPMIYKPYETSPIVFVANDTSNGYRPKKEIDDSVSKVPLSYITDTESVGILSLPDIKNTSPTDLKTIFPDFAEMIMEWKHGDVPFAKNGIIPYGSKKLQFPSRIPAPFQAGIMSGGRRKTRKPKAKKSKKSKKSKKN